MGISQDVVIIGAAAVVILLATALALCRLIVLRGKQAERRGAKGSQPRARHTKISGREDALPSPRDADESGYGEDADDDIIGDDNEPQASPRRAVRRGGMPLPDEAVEALEANRTDLATPMADDPDEDELLKRVAELLKDQKPTSPSGGGEIIN